MNTFKIILFAVIVTFVLCASDCGKDDGSEACRSITSTTTTKSVVSETVLPTKEDKKASSAPKKPASQYTNGPGHNNVDYDIKAIELNSALSVQSVTAAAIFLVSSAFLIM
ncbi:hypothetical protein AKO1_005536 [Acrasis kona]|uniref:Uncharacterized protein n=1 Tax=Acrasis kona TaxID=1008807 RepID=A0AAW2YKU7_9EUKA